MLNFAIAGFDRSPAVLLQVLAQEEWLKVLGVSLDPSAGQELRGPRLAYVAHDRHVNTCLEMGDDTHRRHQIIEGFEQRGIVGSRQASQFSEQAQGLVGEVVVHVGLQADLVEQVGERAQAALLLEELGAVAYPLESLKVAKGHRCASCQRGRVCLERAMHTSPPAVSIAATRSVVGILVGQVLARVQRRGTRRAGRAHDEPGFSHDRRGRRLRTRW